MKIDFTNCNIIQSHAYNGANGKKIAIEYEGTIYLLKFSPQPKAKKVELSYSNSVFSEHIASSIFNFLGVKAHETMLGTYDVKGVTKIVCACKDFTQDGKRFFDFCSLKNTVLDTSTSGTGVEISEILETIHEQKYIDPIILENHFWDMFVIDAFVANFDRHNGNWGFLYDEKNNKAEIAPVYDCGSCLLPQADDNIMNIILHDKRELEQRINIFPSSIIKNNDVKLNYKEVLLGGKYEACNEAIKRIVPRINMKQIEDFIDNVPYLSDLQRQFYKYYLNARYQQILLPSYNALNK